MSSNINTNAGTTISKCMMQQTNSFYRKYDVHNLLPTAIVIDDDKNIVSAFAEYLEMQGINVVAVGYDGKDAVEMYKKYRPDILFSDLDMPQYDGIYALENIRELEPDAKVAIITANRDSKIFERLEHFKPTEVFGKPPDMNKMAALLENVTQTKHTIVDYEKKALVSFVITEALLKLSPSANNEVGDRLYARYHCYFSDCLEHPEYLKDILQEIFGNGSAGIIKGIKEKLAESEDQNIRNFVFVMSK